LIIFYKHEEKKIEELMLIKDEKKQPKTKRSKAAQKKLKFGISTSLLQKPVPNPR